ncbi:MAG: phosphatase PAP2 family protein [Bacteroidetes bacterium]|nr:MAG: phosphatase PAP2 family protein [Bacteroidota bacterium]
MPQASEADFAAIQSQQQVTDEVTHEEIRYWNAAYPSYRWHQILMAVSAEHKGHKNGGRVVIMHLAVYDALAAVWSYKKAHAQAAPCAQRDDIACLGRNRDYSSFICEYSAAAGAAHGVIQYYFPDRTAYLDSLLDQFLKARLATGLQFPADLEQGLAIGRQIAAQYIAYAKTDRTDRTWDGELPSDPTLWSGTPSPYDPMKRQWRPLTLERPDQFRPGPPPSDWTADMEELRAFHATHQSSDIAWKWKSEPVWDDLIERKLLAYDWDPFAAARANALFHTARFDGIIAAWDGKYHYWGIRPFQYDTTFRPILIQTPNFPGYPAGHTTVAGSIAAVLSHLFPRDRGEFEALARECSESRFEGGVHFRTDNEVGLEVGRMVGEQVIKAFR